MSNVIITGVAGFLGSHLAEYLIKHGHKVVGIDDLSGGYRDNVPEGCDFLDQDLSEVDRYGFTCQGYLKHFKPDVLFHLAADATEGRSHFTPMSATRNNVMASVNIFTAAIKAGVKKIVFTSSISRYGNILIPFREDDIPKPVDIYGINKLATEQILKVLAEIHDIEYTILAPYNVYGPRQDLSSPYRNVVGIFMNKIMKGEAPVIYGDGEQSRSFTHVDNITPYVAEAGFSKKCDGKVINLGSDKEYTINQLLETVLTEFNSSINPIYIKDRPLEVKHAYSSHALSKLLLDFKETVSFEEGIKRTATWAREQGPQEFKYIDLELVNEKTPETWSKKTI